MLTDQYSRRFRYLRLSVTDACNFKCGYCLPNGYQCTVRKRFLSALEISNLVAGFAQLGLRKIRLTGGEPTLRTDIVDIVRNIKTAHPDLHIALTTNAYRLESLLPALRDVGLNAINISLDTLNRETFKRVCGIDKASDVKRAAEISSRMGFKTKINAVLLKDINDHEISDFMTWIQDFDLSVRFIELMRTNDNVDYYHRHFLATHTLMESFRDGGWSEVSKSETDGPAIEFAHNDFKGRIGFIAPYSKNFCTTCNRLRVSSIGGLRLCLFGEGDDVNLRSYLSDTAQRFDLINAIMSALFNKPLAHRLDEQNSGSMKSLSVIGG